MNITSLYDTEFNRNLFENNVERTLTFNEKKIICWGKKYFYFIYLFSFFFFLPGNKD